MERQSSGASPFGAADEDTALGRREFILALSGVATWPFTANAETGAMPIIGFLHAGAAKQNAERLAAYRKGLAQAGYVEGQNVAIEFRWAEGQDDRLPEMADDLVRRQVSVIATPFSTDAALAAKSATTTIPIVFGAGSDAVAVGLVASLSRPGGNVTGVTSLNSEIAAKRLGLIREMAPQAVRHLALVNPTSVLADPFVKDLQAGAASLGIQVEVVHASTVAEIDAAFASLPPQPGTALLVSTDALFFSRLEQIIALAAHYALPVMFDNREAPMAGGLVSYGTDIADMCRQVGVYTGRILNGEKPTDLPVMQATKYDFVINLRTAKALGLAIPSNLLAIADEVIE